MEMKSSIGRIIIIGLCVMALVSVACAKTEISQGLPSGANIIPNLVKGNPDCGAAGCTNPNEYKIEKSEGSDYTGTYNVDSTHTIIIQSYSVMGQTSHNSIDWQANFDVSCIIMKGGNGADVYCYNPPVRADTSLTTPIVSSGKPAGISHIILCYDTPSYNTPEFPVWFISITAMAGLLGAVLIMHRRIGS